MIKHHYLRGILYLYGPSMTNCVCRAIGVAFQIIGPLQPMDTFTIVRSGVGYCLNSPPAALVLCE